MGTSGDHAIVNLVKIKLLHQRGKYKTHRDSDLETNFVEDLRWLLWPRLGYSRAPSSSSAASVASIEWVLIRNPFQVPINYSTIDQLFLLSLGTLTEWNTVKILLLNEQRKFVLRKLLIILFNNEHSLHTNKKKNWAKFPINESDWAGGVNREEEDSIWVTTRDWCARIFRENLYVHDISLYRVLKIEIQRARDVPVGVVYMNMTRSNTTCTTNHLSWGSKERTRANACRTNLSGWSFNSPKWRRMNANEPEKKRSAASQLKHRSFKQLTLASSTHPRITHNGIEADLETSLQSYCDFLVQIVLLLFEKPKIDLRKNAVLKDARFLLLYLPMVLWWFLNEFFVDYWREIPRNNFRLFKGRRRRIEKI